jgi:ribosomal protein L11 methyltransferase
MTTEKTPWLRVAVRPSADDRRDALMAALFAAGAQGVQEDGVLLVTHLEPGSDVGTFADVLRGADAAADIAVTELPPLDWSEWRARVGAHQLGPLTIAPPWLADQFDAATTIIIDPAMAFGTGEHGTTRGVVRLLPTVIRPGDVVADLGSGTAVLSIAAIKLGASRAAAIEIDPDATSNALENVERNGVVGRVQVLEGDAGVLLPLVAPVRVILANIISSVLLELLPLMAESLTEDGRVILSGILIEERTMMLEALAVRGWRVLAEDSEDGWWSVVIAR